MSRAPLETDSVRPGLYTPFPLVSLHGSGYASHFVPYTVRKEPSWALVVKSSAKIWRHPGRSPTGMASLEVCVGVGDVMAVASGEKSTSTNWLRLFGAFWLGNPPNFEIRLTPAPAEAVSDPDVTGAANPPSVSEIRPFGAKYEATYVVLELIVTGAAKVTTCQPDGASLLKVASASLWPAEVHRRPRCGPPFARPPLKKRIPRICPGRLVLKRTPASTPRESAERATAGEVPTSSDSIVAALTGIRLPTTRLARATSPPRLARPADRKPVVRRGLTVKIILVPNFRWMPSASGTRVRGCSERGDIAGSSPDWVSADGRVAARGPGAC